MHPTVELNRLIADKIIWNHFAATGIRPDIFAYARYDGSAVYRPVPEEGKYGLICRRYFGGSDWRECVENGLQILSLSKKNGDFSLYRRTLSVWEFLFYFGRVNDDDAALARSRDLFQPRTPDRPSN